MKRFAKIHLDRKYVFPAERRWKCVNVGALALTSTGIEVGAYATIGINSSAIRKVKPGTTFIIIPAKSI